MKLGSAGKGNKANLELWAACRFPFTPASFPICNPTMWLTLLFVGTAALFLAMTSAALIHLQWAQSLPALSDLGTADCCGGTNDDRVQCSVIVAARDEESQIEDTVRHLLAQLNMRPEVIVIDDRSTDRTDEISGG